VSTRGRGSFPETRRDGSCLETVSTSQGSGMLNFLSDTTRFLFLCLETPVLVITLVIIVGIFRERHHLSMQRKEQRNGIGSAGRGKSDGA
jgi:hypothetical protein